MFSFVKKHYVIIVVMFMASNTSYAFDLLTAYQKALEYNADYLAQVAQNKAGQENIIQGRAALLPQLTATGAMNENYLGSGGTYYYYDQPTLGLQLSQVIFDFGKFSTYAKSKYQTQVSDLQLNNAKQKLIVTVAQSYFDVLYAGNLLNAIQTTKSALQDQLNNAKRSFDVGTVTIADVNDAQAGYDTAVAQEVKAQNDLVNKKNIFQNITGLDANQIQPVLSNIALISSKPLELRGWVDMANTGNINIKIANKQLNMANEDIDIARAGHLPTVSLTGQYNNLGNVNLDGADSQVTATQFNSQTSQAGVIGSSYTQGVVGITVSIPLYSGGNVSSQARAAIANYEASMQQLLSTKRNTQQDVQNAYWQVENGISLVKAQTQALKSATIKLKSDKTGYQVGIRTSIDLVNSEKNYAQSIQDFNKSRYDYLVYKLQLMYLVGNLDIDFLRQINANIQN